MRFIKPLLSIHINSSSRSSNRCLSTTSSLRITFGNSSRRIRSIFRAKRSIPSLPLPICFRCEVLDLTFKMYRLCYLLLPRDGTSFNSASWLSHPCCITNLITGMKPPKCKIIFKYSNATHLHNKVLFEYLKNFHLRNKNSACKSTKLFALIT